MVESTINPVQMTKVTDVKIAYGKTILHGVIKEVHGTWMMIKVQAVTERDGTKIDGPWMIGRDFPVAISDRI